MGGLLGLFLGCSVLSIVEIFYFLLVCIMKRCKTSREVNDSVFEVNEKFDIERKIELMQKQLNLQQLRIRALEQKSVKTLMNSCENEFPLSMFTADVE
jgi:hypothetical protein